MTETGLAEMFEEAQELVRLAEGDVRGDCGDEAWESGGAWDIIKSIARYQCTPAVGRELVRCELGTRVDW